MAILRSITVGPSLNSSVFGILTNHHSSQEYHNPDYHNKMSGEPIDCKINLDSTKIICPEGTALADGIYKLIPSNEIDRGYGLIAIGVKNQELVCVVSTECLVWVKEGSYNSKLIDEVLRTIMRPDRYEAYTELKRRPSY